MHNRVIRTIAVIAATAGLLGLGTAIAIALVPTDSSHVVSTVDPIVITQTPTAPPSPTPSEVVPVAPPAPEPVVPQPPAPVDDDDSDDDDDESDDDDSDDD